MKTMTKKFIASIIFLIAVLVLMGVVISSFTQQANANRQEHLPTWRYVGSFTSGSQNR
jgi:uncharacterized alpha/beta hydrolase family protein